MAVLVPFCDDEGARKGFEEGEAGVLFREGLVGARNGGGVGGD